MTREYAMTLFPAQRCMPLKQAHSSFRFMIRFMITRRAAVWWKTRASSHTNVDQAVSLSSAFSVRYFDVATRKRHYH